MSKFDELKVAAELAMQSASDFEYEQFQSNYGPAKFLELLAIQAQLVEAVAQAKNWHNGDKWRESKNPHEEKAWLAHCQILDAVLSAAGAQP